MNKLGIALAVSLVLLAPVINPINGLSTFVLSQTGYLDATQNLLPGWNSETVYQTKPLGPISLCENGAHDVLILDKAAHEIVELELDGTVLTYLSTGNFSFNAIAYQPNADRVIALSDSAFYDVGTLGVMQEHPSDIAFSTMAVDSNDDSIYTGHWAQNSTIYHFAANGSLIEPIRSGVEGCAQLAFDPVENLLFFSETFPGRISMLNLTSNSTTILTSGIAIPGTGEGISLAVSPVGDLYYMVGEGVDKGFWKYNGTGFQNIMGSKLGIGPIAWSQKFDAVLCTAGYGACIVKYDPNSSEPERLTPTVNTGSIVETSDGTLLLGIEKTIHLVESGVFSDFIANLSYSCNYMALDNDENIYVSLSNDSPLILNVYPNRTYSTWFSGSIDGTVASMCYDSMNDMMILLTSRGVPTQFDLWRLPIDNPDDYSKVLTITNVTNGDCAVDKAGNIYVLERSANIIYIVPDGSNQAEVLHTNVVEHAYLVAVNIAYSSVLDALVLGRNDDLQVWPCSGDSSYILTENNVGIDNDGVFENSKNELVCTHSGQIYRLSYNVPPPGSFPTEIVIITIGGVIVVAFVVLLARQRNRI